MGSEWTDKECQTCSVCMTSVTASVNADDERTRLLDSRPDSVFYSNLFFVGILFIFLCAGVGIGAYLLISEGIEWQLDGMYSVIPREEWNPDATNGTFRELSLPVGKVLLVETGTGPCMTKVECLGDVKKLQRLHLNVLPDIGYNFLIGGDGRIYEGRGWYYQCNVRGYIDEDTLTIGILGSFNEDPPSEVQMNEIRLLLQFAKNTGILRKCYSVIIRRDATSNERILLEVAAELQHDESVYC